MCVNEFWAEVHRTGAERPLLRCSLKFQHVAALQTRDQPGVFARVVVFRTGYTAPGLTCVASRTIGQILNRRRCGERLLHRSMPHPTTHTGMHIALLGCGLMGQPMARRLMQAGHTLTVWNRTRSKAQALSPDGARLADSPVVAT